MIRTCGTFTFRRGGWSHIRGNDSFFMVESCATLWLIPHTWEWFDLMDYAMDEKFVDPTYVGMIRTPPYWFRILSRWSHIRGNDSPYQPWLFSIRLLIPHTWEWFVRHASFHALSFVDPTNVGMIRGEGSGCAYQSSWSHKRGNDSQSNLHEGGLQSKRSMSVQLV